MSEKRMSLDLEHFEKSDISQHGGGEIGTEEVYVQDWDENEEKRLL